MSDLRQSHLLATKRIMRYLKGTLGYGIIFPHQTKDDDNLHVVAYSYSDWCGDLVDRKKALWDEYFYCLALPYLGTQRSNQW